MTPQTRRIVIPLIVTGVAVVIVLATVLGPRAGGPAPAPPGPAPTDTTTDTTTGSAAETPDGTSTGAPPGIDDDATAEGPPAAEPETAPPADARPLHTGVSLEGLQAVALRGPIETATDLEPLGSFDPFTDRWKIEFADHAAGIRSIVFSDQWETAPGRREVQRLKKEIRAGRRTIDDLPAEQRYVLATSRPLGDVDVPVLAARSVVINDGPPVSLFGDVWSATGAGAFETEIRNADGAPVLRITRRFVPGRSTFDLRLEQRIRNLTADALQVKWIQYGPCDLRQDRSRYLDRRRFRFGYMLAPEQDPSRLTVLSEDNDLLFERVDVIKRWDKAETARAEGDFDRVRERVTLWPNVTSLDRGYELSWLASTNRYFGIALHPVLPDPATGSRSLAPVVREMQQQATSTDANAADIFTTLFSPQHEIPAGETLALDVGVYVGPLDRHVLGEEEPYTSLAMRGLILYQMSSFCAICTFQWLAHLLLGYLSILHAVVFDWGVAIIILVITVRTLLHPVTKKSQISMQRFGKQMGAMKPELDKLREKYGDDSKRMQKEQMRLFREHGVSPLGCLGFLPMFLQMPIWVALYAMLYFAFDLRQEPAFYGLFQLIGDWPFLADLSAADHFFGELAVPRTFFLWNITGINLLPILMGAIFYVQQKYMTPPSPTMTDEQKNQQRIMRIMTVVLFPLMLYSAPSGLTLYILTSSCIGIIESRYIRQHVSEMDLKPKSGPDAPGAKKKRKKKPRDAQGRAFAAAMDRAKAKAEARRRGPKKSYKRRK